MMQKFRKKPVVVEAIQRDGHSSDAVIIDWVNQSMPSRGADGRDVRTAYERFGELHIVTLEGEMHVSVGDWVIKGVAGEFYPCKPDIFEATYEAV
jgi:hypothetical protein